MTDTLVRSAGPTIPDVYMVSADQETIIGNGTTGDPLRAGPSAGSSILVQLTSNRALGTPVVAASSTPTVGIVRVTGGSSGISGGGFSALAQVIGVITELGDGVSARMQSSGLVTLDEDDWDGVTGDSGGLTRGAVYYASTTIGLLTTTPPSASGSFIVQVGIAMNPTTMLLSCPCVPRVNP